MPSTGSFKNVVIKDIALTTGGTTSLSTGEFDITSPTLPDRYKIYRVTGTETLVSNYALSPTGTAYKNIQLHIYWEAVCTPNGNIVTIFGETIPSNIVDGNFLAICTYNGSAWVVQIFVDWATQYQVGTDRYEDASITTAKYIDKSVTLTKLEDVTAGRVILGNASNIPTATAVTGDVTISSTGVTAIGAAKVLNAMIDSMAANKLTGTIDNSRLSAIPITKLASSTRLASKYSDSGTTATTSAETLYNQVVTGGEIDTDGKGIRVTVAGSFAANANTKTLVCKFAGNTYATNGVTTAPNGTDFRAVYEIIRSGATSAVGFSEFECGAASQGIQKSKAGITWANDNYVTITGQNGTASANDIVLSMVIVEKIH